MSYRDVERDAFDNAALDSIQATQLAAMEREHALAHLCAQRTRYCSLPEPLYGRPLAATSKPLAPTDIPIPAL